MDYASSLLGLLPGGRRTPGLKELLSSVESYLPADQVARIREAAEFGASAHKGQKRLSGEPYIAHPVAAAAILADLRLDADTIVAAILHDVIEDTPTPKDQLAAKFGRDVAELVGIEVSRLRVELADVVGVALQLHGCVLRGDTTRLKRLAFLNP